MSIIKHKEQRVGIFIDAQNLYHTRMYIQGQEVHHQKVSFQQEYEDLMKGFGF